MFVIANHLIRPESQDAIEYAFGPVAASLYSSPSLLALLAVPLFLWFFRIIRLSALGEEDYNPTASPRIAPTSRIRSLCQTIQNQVSVPRNNSARTCPLRPGLTEPHQERSSAYPKRISIRDLRPYQTPTPSQSRFSGLPPHAPRPEPVVALKD